MTNLTKMHNRILSNTILIMFWLGCAQHIFGQQKVIQLYNGHAPGSENWNWEEKTFFIKTPLNANVACNVTKPTLTVFSPEKANGISVVIFPGGGLRVLNVETEGSFVAKELIKKGFTVFLLKYRLVQTHTDDPWQETLNSLKDTSQLKSDNNARVMKLASQDAIHAIRYVRAHANEYKIDSNKVGALGFSAGGGLVQYLSLEADSSARPNFSGFIYSVYRQKVINSNAPPAFIACATDDVLAFSTNSTNLYNAWVAAKNSAELHVYKSGGHGLRGFPASSWIQRYIEWIFGVVLQKTKQ